MTMLWTSDTVAKATGGQATEGWTASGVSIDTRSLRRGDLFVALKATRDGHDFVAEALAKGAAAALVSHRPPDVPKDAPLLIVDDVLAALSDLGRAGRERTDACVIAVTGSAGKTSTKEMLRDVLSPQGKTHAAEASYNNHWGVPLTLARMPEDTEFAVIEIGMNAPGEIAPLAQLTRPHIAIITTIAEAHLAAFDSLSGIAQEKASIFVGLEPGGVAIVNDDVETRDILLQHAMAYAAIVRRFGHGDSADFQIVHADVAGSATVVEAEWNGAPLVFKIGVAGRHFAMNALAALAAVDAAGADLAIATGDLGRWSPPAGRGTREVLALDPVEDDQTAELIDDAFNANPASMAAALEVLAEAQPVDDIGRIGRGRRIAVLGDMLELGPDEAAMHRAIANHPAMETVAQVHCVGPRMQSLWDALPEHRRGLRANDAEALASKARTLIDAGDVVLVKGSKGSRVSLVARAIRNLGHPRPIKI
ncbi:MAG: UDP-N-acetylmuramoyl-tripeptide--D-alanyl-D-alanine ligase [Pseudomonadota bacterium]